LEIDMSIGSENRASALENLSAMADGEVDSAGAARACSAWRDDSSVRLAWHSYHLIGDVLRSEDLAIRHDASLVAALRRRLANEPTVLAPEATPQPTVETSRRAGAGRASRWSWIAPSAVAAGFVMVAGALMVTRQSAPNAEAGLQTASTRFDRGAAPDASLDSSLQPLASAADTKVVRDARLDRYLAAHQQFAGSTALGVPSGFLRNAAAEAPGR
jgi:sigma-E factor negative regulatory protein RseA